MLTVDLAILTVGDEALQILLVERGSEPFRGQLALPGGFLRDQEDLLDAAQRELREETNLDGARLHLEQLGTYGRPERDPRGRVVTVVYLAIAPNLPTPVAGTDAAAARWAEVDKVLGRQDVLAFDHAEILDEAVERARALLEHTTLATTFCQEVFTMGELRGVYEAVWSMRLDPRNFSRKVTQTQGFVEPVGKVKSGGPGRPAQHYRAGPATVLYPPMLRAGGR
jgi:8-oxo-dGTP diphosphatase